MIRTVYTQTLSNRGKQTNLSCFGFGDRKGGNDA